MANHDDVFPGGEIFKNSRRLSCIFLNDNRTRYRNNADFCIFRNALHNDLMVLHRDGR